MVVEVTLGSTASVLTFDMNINNRLCFSQMPSMLSLLEYDQRRHARFMLVRQCLAYESKFYLFFHCHGSIKIRIYYCKEL